MTFVPAYIEAGSPNIAEQAIRVFATSDHECVRRRIADHARCPLDVLWQLASDLSIEVRCAVGANPKANNDLLEHLAGDGNPDVRFSLAENPLIPRSVLNKLAEDSNCFVRERARETIRRIVSEKEGMGDVLDFGPFTRSRLRVMQQ